MLIEGLDVTDALCEPPLANVGQLAPAFRWIVGERRPGLLPF